MSTLRSQLHASADRVERAAVLLAEAQKMYDTERNALNTFIDRVCPLEAPNGRTIEVPRALNKIGLIKLVREATSKFKRDPASATDGCMGLKDAKDLVEAYIADGWL